MMRGRVGAVVAMAVTLGLSVPARGNDSVAEMQTGGLVFTRSAAIAMEKEELRIALDAITVRYEFVNRSGKPVTLTIAFPLPDIDLTEPDLIALPSGDPVNFVGFETKVDGRPAKFSFDQRAFVGDKDVSGLLHQLQFPLLPVGTREVRIDDLPAATRDKMVAGGLLTQAGSGEGGKPIYGFAWVVKTSAVRQQTFAADDRPVSVEHRYRPSLGIAADTILRGKLRRNKGLAGDLARYSKDYCVTDALYAGVDKLAARGPVGERRISYVLHTGANWAGPIKSFKLTLDPGGKERLVSLCTPGLTPVADNPLVYEASNFTPTADLKVLMLGKF